MKMTSVSEDQIKKIAQLAKLKLEALEIKKIGPQLTEILNYFKILDELKTSQVEPTAQVTGLHNVKRNDCLKGSLPVKTVMARVKNQENNLFKTKLAIKKT